MTRPTRSFEAKKPGARSRVTNGGALLDGIDGRSRAGRRMRDIMNSLATEFGAPLSTEDLLQVRSVAAMTLDVERLAACLINGEPVDSEALSRANNALQRALNGLRRRKVKPKADPRVSLAEALAAKAQARATG